MFIFQGGIQNQVGKQTVSKPFKFHVENIQVAFVGKHFCDRSQDETTVPYVEFKFNAVAVHGYGISLN